MRAGGTERRTEGGGREGSMARGINVKIQGGMYGSEMDEGGGLQGEIEQGRMGRYTQSQTVTWFIDGVFPTVLMHAQDVRVLCREFVSSRKSGFFVWCVRKRAWNGSKISETHRIQHNLVLLF